MFSYTPHLRSRIVLLLSLYGVAMFATGCSSSKETVRTGEGGEATDSLIAGDRVLDDNEAMAAVRMLESDPLGPGSAGLRRDLFTWLISSPRLADFATATPPIDELQTSEFPYKEELLMQYLFGAAAWSISGNAGTIVDQQEAGVRSLIAAYRTIVQGKPAKRDPFLDTLDGLRRRGELRGYIQRIHDMKGP